jgi:superfamily I DNA/RNA helicase
MGTKKAQQTDCFALCFKDEWHVDLRRASKSAQSAFSTWASRILKDQPNTTTRDDPRFRDLPEVGPNFRSCALTQTSVLVFEVDEGNHRVILWMVDSPKAIHQRLGHQEERRIPASGIFSTAILDEWGLDEKYWHLLKDKPLVARTILELEPELGGEMVSSLLQCLLPKPLSQVTRSATRHVDSAHEIVGRQLDHFLLVLEPEQSDMLQRFTRALMRQQGSTGGPWLLKGGPGSGKSTISLYCIHEVLSAPPGLFGEPPQVLFTTFTHALERTSKKLLDAWGQSASRGVALKTINQLAMRYDDRGFELLDNTEQKRVLRDAIKAVPENCPFGESNKAVEDLFDEIENFICGFGLTQLEQYLNIERHGRNIPLPKPKRQYVWKLHQALTKILHEKKLTTFARSANHATAKAKGKYDYVFIDEAQDLRPIQIRLCMKLCKTPTNLFLTADVNQGIYNTGTSWKSISEDLRFRGRSMVLKRNHRNTASIAIAIQTLAPKGLSVDQETLNVDSHCVAGTKPTIVNVHEDLLGAEALERVVRFLEEGAVDERVGLGCCAILVPTRAIGVQWEQALPKYFNAKFFESREVNIHHRGVKILTIHAAKGLQFPVVAVVGLTGDAIGFVGPKDDPESADEVRRRLLFVACSRAMRHLMVQTSITDPIGILSSAIARRDLWSIENIPSHQIGATDDDPWEIPF